MQSNVRLTALFLILASAGFAQSTYGTIYGSVTDPSSAVVRDALVQATNTKTGEARSTKTSGEGLFRFVNLDPGSYTVSVSAPGFSTSKRKDIPLTARD